MKLRLGIAVAVVLVAVVLLGLLGGTASATFLTAKEQLGKKLFFDSRLSQPAGQACAACHAPAVGFTGPTAKINAAGAVYEGAVPNHFGNRKPPSAAYGGASPNLFFDGDLFIGGMFWDGRATGWTLDDPLAEQAMGPFLNPLEQNNASKLVVVNKVKTSSYASLFKAVWGKNAFDNVDAAYERIARSISSYEQSKEVNPFSSRYDCYLKTGSGLTRQELKGLALFEGKGKCAGCHLSQPANGQPPLFTDFTYDNLGIPKNPRNPFYKMSSVYNPDGASWIDPGLGGFLASTQGQTRDYSDSAADNMGKHKVPTLRNVDKRPYPSFVKAYGHNGYFKSLYSIVHFYNTRDVPGAGWPAPEVAATMNTTELGNLGLSSSEEWAIVAFLRTLTDR
jgi:cytochrome c peroxidase